MTDDQIRAAMRSLAERAQPAGAGLTDAVLRRTRKRRDAARASVAGGSVLAVAAVAGLVFAAPWNGGGQALSPAGTANQKPSCEDLIERHDHDDVFSPPKNCEWEGDRATADPAPKKCRINGELHEVTRSPGVEEGYYNWSWSVGRNDNVLLETRDDGHGCPKSSTGPDQPPKLDPLPDDARQLAALQVNETWYLADPDSGELTETDWSWVTVSPDGERYAVLEKEVGAGRVGIVDRASGEVERWIDTPAGTGHVYWSPTSDQLVGTVYDKPGGPDGGLPDRSGAFIAEVDDPNVPVRDVPVDFQGGHVDYSWSNAVFWNGDGTGLVASYTQDDGMTLGVRLLALTGEVEKTIPDTGALTPANGVASSPDNRYAMTEPNKTKNHVIDLETGEVVENTRSFGAEAWLDDDQFIGDLAWTEITGELAVIETDGTVANRLWKAPKDVVVDALAVSRE